MMQEYKIQSQTLNHEADDGTLIALKKKTAKQGSRFASGVPFQNVHSILSPSSRKSKTLKAFFFRRAKQGNRYRSANIQKRN